jgi:uncharacterized protein YcbX
MHAREAGVDVIGTVRAIWRYPVKGMAGESLQAAHVGPGGVAGDGRWAVRETSALRTVVRKVEQNVGIYRTIRPAAQVRVGDAVGLA